MSSSSPSTGLPLPLPLPRAAALTSHTIAATGSRLTSAADTLRQSNDIRKRREQSAQDARVRREELQQDVQKLVSPAAHTTRTHCAPVATKQLSAPLLTLLVTVCLYPSLCASDGWCVAGLWSRRTTRR